MYFNQSNYTTIENNGPMQPVLILSTALSTSITITILNKDNSKSAIGMSNAIT